jgi:hypothetical protein
MSEKKKRKKVVEVVGKNGERNEKKDGPGFQPKTFVITAAQAIQTEGHAFYYGYDSYKGAPNVPLIRNMDEYAEMHSAKTMILQMQGMGCDEIQLHPFFEKRKDVYIDESKLSRLEAKIDAERAKIERKRDKLDNKLEKVGDGIADRKRKEGDTDYLESVQDLLEGRKIELESELEDIRGSDYFNTINVISLNNKVVVADLIVPPQNVDPTTGRLDIAQNQLGKTIIFAHAKQRFKCAPKSVGFKLPRLLMTTGAVTHPNYNTTNSRGDEAVWNHKYGFIVVDVLNEKRYLPRIVPAFKNGTFVDMGIEYRLGSKPKKIGVEALVLGDIHFGDHSLSTMDANYEMIEFFAPKNVFLHDAINGHSMNPHEREDTIRRAIAYREGRLDIKGEFSEAYEEFIKKMAKQFQKTKFYFVYSNHSPDFIRRYLTNFDFEDEPWNDTSFTAALRTGLLEDDDPIETGLGLISLEQKIKGLPDNVYFLKLEEGMVMLGYQLGVHGHKGVNGARGSPRGMKMGYGKVIAGHTHSPEINGDCYTVGTSSIIPLDYAKGQPGTAMPANAVLYSNGLVQLLPIIIGDWKPNYIK